MTKSSEGFLATVVRFRHLQTAILNSSARRCFIAVAEVVHHLGRATQLGQHRTLIEALDDTLSHETLETIASVSIANNEICSAFSVYFTTLEQAYAWPRKDVIATPKTLHDHKLVVQMIYHDKLFTISIDSIKRSSIGSSGCCEAGCLALREANLLLKAASDAKHNRTPLSDEKQDVVNHLYRTCAQDWFLQGDYSDSNSHRQFGRLHEVIRTAGTQRSVQELFQQSAVEMLQRLPAMLQNFSIAEADVAYLFERLQIGVSLAREELFEMVVDEVVWGQTFAKYSKPVGLSTIGAGGADCPMFRMLDAVCGKAEDSQGDILHTELDMRTRQFPPTIRGLIHKIAASRSVRSYIASGCARPRLSEAFRVFQQLLYELYEMHRKKAMRIVLSLRAGQLYTSSGMQNAKAPERYISNTLSKAMAVRFGRDPERRRIPAMAVPVQLKKLSSESAIIRLDFDAPIVLAAGDGILVTVHSDELGYQTRTYSVTRTYPVPDFHIESDRDLHATRSVEICCRSAGLVSTYICHQESPFRVSVALSPHPHFRIKQNKKKKEKTYFVAQNGGAGVFFGWLSRRETLAGTYTLVIGARDLHSFMYTQELLFAMDKFSAHLRVLLCLSRLGPQDLALLSGRQCQIYHGRVPAALAILGGWQSAPTYVCGSSSFGLSIAKALNCLQKNRKLDIHPRVGEVNTSRMPDLHVHGAAARSSLAEVSAQTSRTISRSEMATHNTPGDIWISIGNFVYDISVLASFHPGGEKTLLCRAGLNADDMFNSVHEESYEVTSLLSQMMIGKLENENMDSTDGETILSILVQSQNDLTNSSRFEHHPTGSVEQLERAPPSELVHGSLSQFCKVWKVLLEKCNASCYWSDSIALELDSFERRLAERQEDLYKSVFWDEEQCALGLRTIFDEHREAVVKIHDVIDELKIKAAAMHLKVEEWKTLFERATPDITAIMGGML